MCTGERPIGAAKGKPTNTIALRPPPPHPAPSRHAKPFQPVFFQFQILGKTAGAEGAEFVRFFWPPEGKIFFTLCVYTSVENLKMGAKHKTRDPRLPTDLGR